jgi:cardiolipin synthase A/B
MADEVPRSRHLIPPVSQLVHRRFSCGYFIIGWGTFDEGSHCYAAMTTRLLLVRRGVFAGVALLALAGCANVPDVDDAIAGASRASAPSIVGADGSLITLQGPQLVSRVAGAGDSPLLARHLAVEQAIAGAPLTIGNTTQLLRDGDETFAAIFDAIRDAKHHVNLEYYTLEDVSSGGESLSALLQAKRHAGVSVNVIYDSYGSSGTPRAFFDALKSAGVNLVEFRPVNPLEAAAKGYSPNDRDHRKIMIVDGRVAVVGGINLASYYQSKVPGSDAPSEGETEDAATGDAPDKWRDLALRIEGPAVEQLQGLFLGHWRSGGGDPLDQSGFFPRLVAKDGEAVRIIGSSPQQDVSRYYVTLVSAIRSAEQRIWLTTAYFVPTFEEKRALIDAAKRGVDVRLMLPANSDAPQAVAVARSHYYDLLEAGVRILEIDDVILHSKSVTIDGVWSAVGSSNFDHRSVLYNDEVDAVVLGENTASELESVFEEDAAGAREIRLEEWRNRPMTDRLVDFFQRSLQHLL